MPVLKPTVSDSGGLGLALNIGIYNKFLGDTDAGGPGATLRITAPEHSEGKFVFCDAIRMFLLMMIIQLFVLVQGTQSQI